MARGIEGAQRAGDVAPVRRVSVVDELVEQMTRRLASGEWAPGAAIPSLRDFAAASGVSTLTVREAIRTLQARGWLETRHGVGTFVATTAQGEQFASFPLEAADVDEYVDFVDAREAIESSIIDFAVRRRTPDDLARLIRVAERMRQARTDHELFVETDGEFHFALADAAHNRILARTMLAIRVPQRNLALDCLSRMLPEHGNLDPSVDDHLEITEAVRSGDVERGRLALRRIADRSRAHILGGGRTA
ncbi:FadR/GntR family transcriptional regulator [Pseudonocardia ailaonensis]|uniref:FadR/GntR family transcriptional regulator n=1 Tax=Pseudonocardia ailaonensis TaxID=367279 RepID=A0ABN2MVE6_9PSEU